MAKEKNKETTYVRKNTWDMWKEEVFSIWTKKVDLIDSRFIYGTILMIFLFIVREILPSISS